MESSLDFLIVGPAHPYRGGIAETNHELAWALQKQGKSVKILSFSALYPKLLFPGKTQYSKDPAPKNINIALKLHAFYPWTWKKTQQTLKQWKPKIILFRYYTPFLAPVYTKIAKGLPVDIKCIGLIDNWTPHEQKPWDRFLNKHFAKQMDGFVTLSETVAKEIKNDVDLPVWNGFHPISSVLPKQISKENARKALGWNHDATIVLFFGLIRKYKGLDLLLHAFATSPLKETNIQLAIVGEFYEPQQRYLELIKHLELENRVLLYPEFADTPKVQNVFCAADAVAQTYRSATQSGVTPLAYHFNTPLLVSDLPGLKAPIETDKSGLITQVDPKEIAEKLVLLLKKDHLKSAQKNIKNALPKYKWSAFTKQLLAFLEKSNEFS